MKNIVVIGASSGIGLELVKKLFKDNKIFAFSRTKGELPDDPHVEWKEFDVTKDELTKDDLPDTIEGFAYCPGTINLKPLRGLKPEDVLHDFEVNALGGFKVFQSVQRQMKKAKTSSAVFFSTVAVQQGMPYHSSVSMAKGAVEGLVRSLAAEFAPSVRVNAIAPSLTDTPLASRLLSTPERKDGSAQRHPLKRVGTTEDIASAAAFLLSDNSSWITGEVMKVDGGMGNLKL